MDSNSASLLGRFTALKNKYTGLETWISVGGWSFTDPGPTQEAFSTMSSTSGNRQTFINGLLKFMNQYGFDGEYFLQPICSSTYYDRCGPGLGVSASR